QYYLGYVNSFLRYWDDYSSTLEDQMKLSNGAEGVRAIPYEKVRDYVYAKNDYASVLEFLDGLIKLIEDGKCDSIDDIEDFMDHTLSKAFPNREPEVGGLLDNVLDTGKNGFMTITDKSASSKYNSVKSYNIFDRRERSVLYKAIEKTIDFMTSDINKHRYPLSKDMKVFVSLINNIVEYISYSLAAYATRVYMIAVYAYPFIFSNVRNQYAADGPRYESAINTDVDTSNTETPILILRTTDEIICRDFMKFKDFENVLDKFLKAIGIESLYVGCDDSRYAYRRLEDKTIQSNMFTSKLISNSLYQFFNKGLHWDYFDGNRASGAAELNMELRTLIYNNVQGIQGISTAKQELLYIIREVSPKSETLNDYKELSRDFCVFAVNILFNIKDVAERLINLKSDNQDYPRFNVTATNTISENLKIVAELYREISTAILFRGRDLEMKINELRNAEVEKTFSSLQIKVPGGNKSDMDSNQNNMSSIPDTTRMPTKLMDIYSSPTFEYLQMIDEYTMYEYGLENDPYYAVGYYSEAFSISQIINTIISKLAAVKKRFDVFFNDKSFTAAYAWVKKHQNDLNQMQFNGAMSVLPYSKDINIKHIDTIIASINSFSENDVASADAMNNFIKKLYNVDGKSIQDLFDTEKYDEKTAGVLYTNFVLFGKDPLNKSDTAVNPIILDTSDKIKQQLVNWIDNVANADATHKGLLDTSKRIEQATNSLKAKVVSVQNNIGSSNTQAPALNGNNADGKNNDAKVEADNDKQSLLDKTLLQISDATSKMWDGLYYPITKALKDQYQYIKEAYSLGRK
ncbi:MAG: hypothetical protein NC114_10800, partial [Ruminococcus flavefaciens]|nr:hypothetical protein [Ruminococcus flavefaciens]